jgi:hypothetical protein
MVKLLARLKRAGTLEVTKAITMVVAKHNASHRGIWKFEDLGDTREDCYRNHER